MITIAGAEGAAVEVYTLSGAQVLSTIADTKISIQSGVYIVRVADKVFKVAVN